MHWPNPSCPLWWRWLSSLKAALIFCTTRLDQLLEKISHLHWCGATQRIHYFWHYIIIMLLYNKQYWPHYKDPLQREVHVCVIATPRDAPIFNCWHTFSGLTGVLLWLDHRQSSLGHGPQVQHTILRVIKLHTASMPLHPSKKTNQKKTNRRFQYHTYWIVHYGSQMDWFTFHGNLF